MSLPLFGFSNAPHASGAQDEAIQVSIEPSRVYWTTVPDKFCGAGGPDDDEEVE
jgi:hypothetical protein